MKKPWYWKARKKWYVDTSEGRVYLGETEDEAYDEWRRLRNAAERTAEKDPTFQELSAAFQSFAERQNKNGELGIDALGNYAFYLDRFNAIHGQRRVSELAPHHVTDWLGSQPGWGPSAQRHAIGSVKRVLNWAATEERRIQVNPLAGMKRPTPKRREKMIETGIHEKLVLAVGSQKGAGRIDRQFRLVLAAVKQCGGRPQDVANVRVEHVDAGITKWTIPEHKTRRHTDRPRVVYLSPCLRTITLILAGNRTKGPLFRGRRGGLTTNAITCRIKRLKKQLGIDAGVVTYSYRHTYITDALERGVDVATVAELVGASVEMIQRHYGHLSTRHDHLKEAALKAVQKRN